MNLNTNQKLIIGIIIVVIIGINAVVYDSFLVGPDLTEGKRNILVLCVDESETRPGMGAVDMGFIIEMNNGSIKKVVPFYPGGKRHPTESEPAEAGSGKLLLHDSLWDADNSKGMRLAKEIIEQSYDKNIDAIIAINTEAVDAIINALKPIEFNNGTLEVNAIGFVREKTQLRGSSMDRGTAVKTLTYAIVKGIKNENKRTKLSKVFIEQYGKGNIIVEPSGSFLNLIDKSLKSDS